MFYTTFYLPDTSVKQEITLMVQPKTRFEKVLEREALSAKRVDHTIEKKESVTLNS